jgi:hypothetical protein
MKIRPYRPGDYDHIRHRPQDSYGEFAKTSIRLMCETKATLVAEHDGIPIALWGAVKLWTGVAYVWSIVSDEARGHGIELTKMVRNTLDEYCEANKIIRCESYVKAALKENVKWVQLLGFQYECTHKHASPTGGNIEIYVRFYHGWSKRW